LGRILVICKILFFQFKKNSIDVNFGFIFSQLWIYQKKGVISDLLTQNESLLELVHIQALYYMLQPIVILWIWDNFWRWILSNFTFFIIFFEWLFTKKIIFIQFLRLQNFQNFQVNDKTLEIRYNVLCRFYMMTFI
jgi:hypothetical protein